MTVFRLTFRLRSPSAKLPTFLLASLGLSLPPSPMAAISVLQSAVLTPYPITSLPLSMEDLTSFFTEKPETFLQEVLKIPAPATRGRPISLHSFIHHPHSLERRFLRALPQAGPVLGSAGIMLPGHRPSAPSVSALVRDAQKRKATHR